MSAVIRWIMWRAVYVFRHQPTDFGDYLCMMDRTRWPWMKFRPYIWHDDDDQMWEVGLANEQSHVVSPATLKVELQVSVDTGRVVGFSVCDEELESHCLQKRAAFERELLRIVAAQAECLDRIREAFDDYDRK